MLRSIVLSLVFALFAISAQAADDKIKDNKNVSDPSNPRIFFKTSDGKMVIELYPKKAPITVTNFLKYVDSGFYNGTIFHRVIDNFVVQGGGYTYDFQQKETGDPIKNEADNGLKNYLATLSMARTSNPDSATTQFFINLKHNEALDESNSSTGYAVFGKVVEGFDVVKKIEKEPRGIHRTHPDAPNYAVIIEKSGRVKSNATD